MNTIHIKTGRPYDVLIGKDILKLCGKRIAALKGKHYKKIALVTDDTVVRLYGDQVTASLEAAGYRVCPYVLPHGEASKNIRNAESIIAFLCENEITRSDLIVALGGGVVGDISGFVASIFLRGIDYVQIPTSLLAAVDSSVGGKTAVNIPAGKNLVGSFWQPNLVLCDVNVMQSLSDDAYGDGMAEIIKYGCIWDAALFEQLAKGNIRDRLVDIVTRCVEIKAQVVQEDEHDHALRQILNFGHTAGHGVEKLSGFATSHGKGVAIGMCIAAAVGELKGRTPSGTAQQIRQVLELHNLPISHPYSTEELATACLGDKKRSGNTINLVLLQTIGKALIHPVETDRLAELFAAAKEI